jgi:hypothetical protein
LGYVLRRLIHEAPWEDCVHLHQRGRYCDGELLTICLLCAVNDREMNGWLKIVEIMFMKGFDPIRVNCEFDSMINFKHTERPFGAVG